MNRRLAALAMAGVFALSLTGCSSNSAGEGEQEIVLPEPTEQSGGSIFGESILSVPENVTLYYVSGDGTSFSAVSRSLTGSSTSDLCQQVVRALLDDSAPERASSVPEGTALLGVEAASGVATVNLSLEAYRASDEQELLKLAASITNSLLSLNEIHGVSVLVAGRALGVASLPLGVRTRSFEGITPAYAQMNVEKEYFLDSDTGTVSRTAALYFPTRDGWLTSETREISFDSSDYASALIRELRVGPLLRSCALSAIPEDVDLLVNNPQIAVTSAGERVLELDFSGALRDYLTFVGLDEWELTGSLTLTLTSFVPEIDAVRRPAGAVRVQRAVVDEVHERHGKGTLPRGGERSDAGIAEPPPQKSLSKDLQSRVYRNCPRPYAGDARRPRRANSRMDRRGFRAENRPLADGSQRNAVVRPADGRAADAGLSVAGKRVDARAQRHGVSVASTTAPGFGSSVPRR